MAPLRIGVIGAGLIGRRHLTVLLSDEAYTVGGIADPAPAAADLARQHDWPYYADYRRMLVEARLDGVIVATPNQLHVPAALAAIERKLPVLVEKPIADSVTAALELVAAAERARVPVLVGHHRRHNPIMRKAAELIGAGGVGAVTAVTGVWLSRKPDDYFKVAWRREAGGGPVLINAIHDIDCLRMFCGEIESVQAATSGFARGFAVEDTAAAVIRFESGALGTLTVSDAVSAPWSWEWTSGENPFYPREWQDCFLIAGTKGSLAVPSLDHWWHEAGQGWGDPLTRRRIPVTPADPYVEQMRNFAAVIRGEAAPVVSGAEGARTLAATMAIKESAASGRPVRIADMLKG
ncbi:MAG TPA: Gfo/Idh/MocA family oxidoreductase [Stellaceae bacterium]|nr:Gfo/Idh/MocA family oxidoreductase [Stellaceae bacterium]